MDSCRERMEAVSEISDLFTSTVLPVALVAAVSFTDEDELADRCIHRPRTPATALRKPVDPAVNVLATASRAGASC